MKNLYIANTDENLAELNWRYDALFAAFTIAAAALDEAKKTKSERVNNSHALFYEREHAFFVAGTKAMLAVKTMYPLLQPVWDACQQARRFEMTTLVSNFEGRDILRSNVLVGEKLYNDGCAVYFDHRDQSLTSFLSVLFHAESNEPREWAVVSVDTDTGRHFSGSTSRDFSTPPPPPYMTKREANLSAWSMCEGLSQHGSRVLLHNVRTGRNQSYINPKSFTEN